MTAEILRPFRPEITKQRAALQDRSGIDEYQPFLHAALLDNVSHPLGDVLKRHPLREIERQVFGA